MKLNASVRGRAAKNERKWPIRPLLMASRALEFVRPRILPGDDPGRVLGEVVDEGRPAAVGGIRIDLLHQFLVCCCAHGGFSC